MLLIKTNLSLGKNNYLSIPCLDGACWRSSMPRLGREKQLLKAMICLAMMISALLGLVIIELTMHNILFSVICPRVWMPFSAVKQETGTFDFVYMKFCPGKIGPCWLHRVHVLSGWSGTRSKSYFQNLFIFCSTKVFHIATIHATAPSLVQEYQDLVCRLWHTQTMVIVMSRRMDHTEWQGLIGELSVYLFQTTDTCINQLSTFGR
jgi:hypothetical protein